MVGSEPDLMNLASSTYSTWGAAAARGLRVGSGVGVDIVAGAGAIPVAEVGVGVRIRVGRGAEVTGGGIGVSAVFKAVDSPPHAITTVTKSAENRRSHLMLPPAHMMHDWFSFHLPFHILWVPPTRCSVS